MAVTSSSCQRSEIEALPWAIVRIPQRSEKQTLSEQDALPNALLPRDEQSEWKRAYARPVPTRVSGLLRKQHSCDVLAVEV